LACPDRKAALSKAFDRLSAWVFPRLEEEVNCIANYAIISGELNSEFKHKPPDEVFDNELTPPHKKRASTQLFDQRAVDLLKKEGYEEFRKDRAKRLAASLNQWLQLGR
jgi:hypothetical protein